MSTTAVGGKKYFQRNSELVYIDEIEILDENTLSNLPGSGSSPATKEQNKAAQVFFEDSEGNEFIKGHPAFDLIRANPDMQPQGRPFKVGRWVRLDRCYVVPNVAGSGNFGGGIAVQLKLKYA